MKGIYGVVSVLAVVMMALTAIPMTEASDDLIGADIDQVTCKIVFTVEGKTGEDVHLTTTQRAAITEPNADGIKLPSIMQYKDIESQSYNKDGILTKTHTVQYQTKWKLRSTGEEYNLGAYYRITDSMIGETITFDPVFEAMPKTSDTAPFVKYIKLGSEVPKEILFNSSNNTDWFDAWNRGVHRDEMWFGSATLNSIVYQRSTDSKYGFDFESDPETVYTSHDHPFTSVKLKINNPDQVIAVDQIAFSQDVHRTSVIDQPIDAGNVNLLFCVYEEYYNTITYMDGNTKIEDEKNIQFGNTVILPTPNIQKTGKKLVGWSIGVAEAKGTFALGSTFNLQGKDYIANAVWEDSQNILVLNANGGSLRKNTEQTILPFIVSSSESFSLRSKSTDFVAPSSEYRLEGWYSGKESGVYAKNCAVPITEDTILNAYWVKNSDQTWKITFDANGGEAADILKDQTIKRGDKIVLPKVLHAPKDESGNYMIFNGWTDESGAVISSSTYTPTKDTTLTASWREGEATDEYEVVFNTNTTQWSIKVHEGDYITKPTVIPTKEAAYFTYWVDSNGEPFNFSQKVESKMFKDGFMVINAGWQKVFDTAISDLKVKVTLDSTLQAKYAFVNWGVGDKDISFEYEANHEYSGDGNYTIKVVVIDFNDVSHTVTQTITVAEGGGGDDPTPSEDKPDIVVLAMIIVAVIGGVAALIVIVRFII